MAKGDGVNLDSALYLAMTAAITSKEGVMAMDTAIAKGDPPICGLDELLTKLFVNYADHQTLRSAGSIVAAYMGERGYVKGGMKMCQDGCTMKQGALFMPPSD